MAKISELPAMGAITGTERIPGLQGGDNKAGTPADLKDYVATELGFSVDGLEIIGRFAGDGVDIVTDTSAASSECNIQNHVTGDDGRALSRYQNGTSGYTATNGLEVGMGDTTMEGFVWNYEDAPLYFGTNNLSRLQIEADGSAVRPAEDDTMTLGTADFRLNEIFSSNGIINTSDRETKENERPLTAAELRVGLRLGGLVRAWQFKDAIARKGEAARVHTGWVAQDVVDAFTAEGLDPFRYGCVGFDYLMKTERTPIQIEHLGEGEIRQRERRRLVPDLSEAGVQRKRYNVRSAELNAFIVAALAQKLADLTG